MGAGRGAALASVSSLKTLTCAELVETDEIALVEPAIDRVQHDEPSEFPGHSLVLSAESIGRGVEVRAAFERAGPDSDVGERLLEEFVAGEVPIVRELQNVEGALVALLGRTVMAADPAVALKVAEVLRETVALSSAIRKRAEASLVAVAGLRAQRAFSAAHAGKGGPRLGE